MRRGISSRAICYMAFGRSCCIWFDVWLLVQFDSTAVLSVFRWRYMWKWPYPIIIMI